MTRCIPQVPVQNPLQMVALAGAVSLLGSLPSHGGDEFAGQSGDGRVDDGAVFQATSATNVNYNFRVDSSLDANKWWVSKDPVVWDSVVTSGDTGGFVGMRVDEPVAAGTGFWFGLSFDHEMQGLKHALRIRYGEDGSSRPPDGTQIYLGYTRFGSAAGVTWDEHGIGSTANPNPASQGPLNVSDIGANTPPAPAFPASFVNSYSWISAIQDATAGGTGGAGDTAANTTRLVIDLGFDPARTLTEMVVVIVYPEAEPGELGGYTPDADPDNNIHFSWTFDGQPILSSSNPNFEGGDILVPEPSRTMLLGLALALLILRRSRPH